MTLPDGYIGWYEKPGWLGLKRHPLKWPLEPINSLGKLNEALAECGIAQRDSHLCIEYMNTGQSDPDIKKLSTAQILTLAVKFPESDRAEATRCWDQLLRIASGALYAQLSQVNENQRWVWRVRPEVAEDIEQFWFNSKDELVDPIISTDLSRQEPTGNRVAKFYCRWWVEDIG